MALNPLFDNQGKPQLFAGEVLILIYPGIFGSLELNNGYQTRFQGTLYLSNARIIFMNLDRNNSRYNFALHLNLVERENFHIGYPRNSMITGYAHPYMTYMPSPGNFKFEMLQDPKPLIDALKNLLTQIRSNIARSNLEQARSQAFIDPNDPDIIYTVDSTKPS